MNLSPLPVQRFYSNIGIPLVGGKLFTYAAGTTTKIATYQNSSGTPNTNPIVLNFRGEANIWLDPALTYKFVLAGPLDTDPPTNPIWSVDNIAGPLTILDITQQFLGRILYPRTATEIALNVTPTNYYYPTTPYLDPRRYMSAWDNGSDQTAGLQTAINVAYADSGRVILPNGFDILCSGVSLTMSGNRTNQGFAIEGPGWNGAKITKTGAPAALITISGAAPTTLSPSEAPLVLEGFTLDGVNKSCHGILLDGIGYWRISNVQARNCNAAFYLFSALLGTIDQGCMGNESNYGILAQRHGGGTDCNAISVKDSFFNLNTTWALDIESGTDWYFEGLQIEANGTSLNVNTGGTRITASVVGLLGFSILKFERCRYESNLGTNILIDAASGTNISFEDCMMITAEANREIVMLGGSFLALRNCLSPGGGGDIWNLTCGQALIENSQVTTLTDTGVTTPVYNNVRTATAFMASGREETATGTLTGCTTSPTGNIVCVQQGDNITLKIPAITGTSNAITATITGGIPARYRPAAKIFLEAPVQDNGTTDIQLIDIDTNGTITLYKNGASNGFTAAGGKGIASTVVNYKKS